MKHWSWRPLVSGNIEGRWSDGEFTATATVGHGAARYEVRRNGQMIAGGGWDAANAGWSKKRIRREVALSVEFDRRQCPVLRPAPPAAGGRARG